MLAEILIALPWLVKTTLIERDTASCPHGSSSPSASSSSPKSTLPSCSCTRPRLLDHNTLSIVECELVSPDQLLSIEGATHLVALPSPAHVRARGTIIGGCDSDLVWAVDYRGNAMVVKGGPGITRSEADMAAYVDSRTAVPVPQVYGAVQESDSTFLYFERIVGEPLDQAWPRIARAGYASVCEQLRELLDELHSLEAPPGTIAGSLDGSNTFAFTFRQRNKEPRAFGNLTSTAEIVNHARQRYLAMPGNTVDRWAALESRVDRSAPLVAVHGDLHPGNILVSVHDARVVRIVGLVDWENGGFYPEWVERFAIVNRVVNSSSRHLYPLLRTVFGLSEPFPATKADYEWVRVLCKAVRM